MVPFEHRVFGSDLLGRSSGGQGIASLQINVRNEALGLGSEVDAAAGEEEDNSPKRAAGLICALSSRWASFHPVRDLHAHPSST